MTNPLINTSKVLAPEALSSPYSSMDGGVLPTPLESPYGPPLELPPRKTREQSPGDKSRSTLSPIEREALVAEIRYWTAVHLEMVEAMSDGVKLGAEQVQDVRLRMLEEPVSTSLLVEVALIALTIILEGPIGAAFATVATRAYLRPVLTGTAAAIVRRTRRPPRVQELINGLRQEANERVLKALAEPRPRRRQQKRLKSGAHELRTLANQLQNAQRQLAKETAVQSREVLDSILQIAETNFIPAAKAAVTYVQQRPPLYKPSPTQALDTPGVEIQANAAASAARTRLAVQAIGLALEEAARDPDLTIDEARSLLADWMGSNELELDEIRHAFRISAEAMIWARILSAKKERGNWVDALEYRARSSNDPPAGETRPPLLTQVTVDDHLHDYLLLRFQNEVEQWAIIDPNAGIPFGVGGEAGLGAERKPGWWVRVSDQEKADFLAQWFYLILRRLPEDFQVQ